VIGVELSKLVRRPRVWACIGLLCALPALVALLLASTRLAPPPGRGQAFLSAVLSNGQLYPAAALAIVLPVFFPITVAVVAGDLIAGEASAGTLRYLLIRPVGRTRLLVAKLVAIAAYVLLAVVTVTATSYLVGVAAFGFGPGAAVGQAGGITSLSGVQLSSSQLALRLAGTIGYIALAMVAVGTIALFLSTVTDSSLAAALGALAVIVTSAVLTPLDAAAVLTPYLPTTRWLAWVDFFRDPILWRDIRTGTLAQLGYIAMLFGAAWANFTTRDITD
jgi:ABC-2 type transport system permease protein